MAIGFFDLVGGEEAGDAAEIVMGADGDDEGDARGIGGIIGGEKGEAAGEAEAEEAGFGVAGETAEDSGGGADLIHGARGDAEVGEVLKFGGEDFDASAGEGAGKRGQAGLFDAEVVDAVKEDDAGVAAGGGGAVEAIAQRAAGGFRGAEFFRKGAAGKGGGKTGILRIGETSQDGNGAQANEGRRAESERGQKKGAEEREE